MWSYTTETVVTGHYTKNIPTGMTGEYLGPTNYNGDTKPQYYVMSTRKNISPENLKNLTEDDIKKVESATNFIRSSQDILDILFIVLSHEVLEAIVLVTLSTSFNYILH